MLAHPGSVLSATWLRMHTIINYSAVLIDCMQLQCLNKHTCNNQVRPKSRHENLEMIQIYDTVTTEPNGKTIAKDMDNGPPCAEIYRKHSLPANLDKHHHSVANATQDCSISNGPKIGPNEMTDEPIYSQPDMNKKREEPRKKREQKKQREGMAALHNVPPYSSSPLSCSATSI